MKIAYLVDYDLNDNSGVIQKIRQQSSQWIELGHTVYFVSSKRLAIYDENFKLLVQEKEISFKLGRLGTALNLFYSSYQLISLLQKVEFDILYMRYRIYMPFILKALAPYKVVMEINSDDTLEYRLHSKITSFYNNLTREKLLTQIDAFVAVSNELKEKFTYLNRPIEVIANGIDTREYQVDYPHNQQPSLVFIGTPNQPWHGLEKIEEMAEYFLLYQFLIIGIDKKDKKNIKYFGYLSKEESSEIIQKADIGIGTLSLYKKGLTEASPLKSRQYLACGLPLIYAYKDTDIGDNALFALRLKNAKDNLDYSKIENFVESVFNNKNIKEKARAFAEEKLDYVQKEKRRLSFFQKVIDER